MLANKDLREKARAFHVPFWSIAKAMGISEPTMTRKMRCELPESEKKIILAIIQEISETEDSTNANANN